MSTTTIPLEAQVTLDQLLADDWNETEDTKRFKEFHAKNPQVYAALVRLARQAKRRGLNKVGIELLVNVARWELMLQTDDPNTDYKINSNYKPYYSRLVMQNEPDLRGMFDTRNMWTNGEGWAA